MMTGHVVIGNRVSIPAPRRGREFGGDGGRVVEPLVIFLHVPKTGGTTLENLLCEIYGSSQPAGRGAEPGTAPSDAPGAVHFFTEGFFLEDGTAREAREMAASLPPTARAITGHFPFGLHRDLARDFVYISLLRDPIDRVVSLYHHFFAWGDDRHAVAQRALSLEEFVADRRCREIDNDQTRRLAGAGIDDDPLPRSALEQAKANLECFFPVFGLTERFDEAVLLLSRALGWAEIPPYARALTNTERPAIASLPRGTLNAIAERNQLDLELYEFAQRRFEHLVEGYGPRFQEDLAALRARAGDDRTGDRDDTQRVAVPILSKRTETQQAGLLRRPLMVLPTTSRPSPLEPSGLRVVLISTYEMGRQPFGLASPMAWLRREGCTVTGIDLAIQHLDEEAVAAADLIAFHLPMHTATRVAASVVPRIRFLNKRAHLCFYGLYAPVNETYLRTLGAETILGGEFEEGLVSLARRLGERSKEGMPPGSAEPQPEPVISLSRLQFLVPDRAGLPSLSSYAHLHIGSEERVVGYTEATRGCKHLCRHCPIVPVYGGRFRVVQPDVVLQDIAAQVEAGAQHITFGDPDFFNAPRHAMDVVRELHRRFPSLTYDVTIKIEHLVRLVSLLPDLKATGCLFVISAVESFDARILELFDKQHTRADILRVLDAFREIGLTLIPTFVPFTPWTTLESYRAFLRDVAEFGLVDAVASIQYGVRLLVPAGSKLLEVPSMGEFVTRFDQEALCYPWVHPDSRVDRLQADVMEVAQEAGADAMTRRQVYQRVWELAHAADGRDDIPELPGGVGDLAAACTIPYLTEPWFC